MQVYGAHAGLTYWLREEGTDPALLEARKRRIFCDAIVYTRSTIILPRQTRDKHWHRENTQKEMRFLTGSESDCAGVGGAFLVRNAFWVFSVTFLFV